MSAHPPSHLLDALAVAAGDGETAGHAETCAECTEYLRVLRAELGVHAPPALDARVQAAVEATAPSRGAMVVSLTTKRRAWQIASLLVPVAAAVFFLVRPRGAAPPAHVGQPPTASSSEVRFKGGMTLSTIVQRRAGQERVLGDVRLHAGDKLRIELAVDEDGPIAAAFLGDDGTTLPLLKPTYLEVGTHLSDDSLSFDSQGGTGWIVAGSAAAVAEAERTRVISGLLSRRVSYAE